MCDHNEQQLGTREDASPPLSKHTQEEEVAEQETLARDGSGATGVYFLPPRLFNPFSLDNWPEGNSNNVSTASESNIRNGGKDGGKLERNTPGILREMKN